MCNIIASLFIKYLDFIVLIAEFARRGLHKCATFAPLWLEQLATTRAIILR